MKKIKIDVVAVPLSGHLYPIMDLVAPLLADEQYQIRLFTGAKKIPLAQEVGFETVTIFPDDPERVDRVANNQKKLNLWTAYKQLSESMDLINELSDQLLLEWQENRPDLVIADFITLSPGLVCQQLGIPWISSMATQFAMESTDGPPCFFGGWDNSRPGLNAVGRKLTRLAKQLVAFCLRSKTKRYQFTLYNEKGQERIYSPYSILCLGMKEIELKSGFPDHYLWAGPCCRSFEKEDKFHFDVDAIQKKKVLVSCGTQLPWGKAHLVDLTKDLEQTYPDYHFIVTMGDSQQKDAAPQQLADNVTVVSYLPYTSYIPKMDYVIHHGGAGIFYNCIQYGKPALILPHDYDQADYAVRGKVAQIAYVASRNKPQQVQAAFQDLVERQDWTALETLSQAFQTYQPSQLLRQEIQRLVGGQE